VIAKRVILPSVLAFLAAVSVLGASSVPAPAESKLKSRISLSIPAEVASGSGLVATGRVARFPGRGSVLLQARREGVWTALVRGVVRNHRFRISLAPGEVGEESLRALLFQRGHRIGASDAKRVRIRVPGTAPPVVPSESPPIPAPMPNAPDNPLPAYWGAWIGPQFTGAPAPQDMDAVTEFEKLSGKSLSLLETFSAWADCSGSSCQPNQRFPETAFEAMRGYGAIPLYSWASAGNGDLSQPEFQLADILAGNFDPYIRQWASEAKAWGYPFFLRFDWEMNGTWFPWSEGVNGNNPGEFVATWRHVHDIFTEVGAINATWVWCPYVNPNGNLQSPATLYPGDGYVDWTCLDGYNRGTTASPTAQYRSFDFLFRPDYREITEVVAPTKPMLLAEVASSENGGSKSEWISDMFAQLPTEYPEVRGLMWFDYYDQGNDWPIETSPSATEAFATGVSDPRYLPNAFGGLPPGLVPLP
jgi:Glycosyl hydrolase family 26